MNNAPVRTVSDAKRDFYTHHTRPINSIYRRVVDELMVEMHLLSVNVDFAYDPIYALGIVTTFDRFMVGYEPEADKASIFNALCRSINSTPEHYRGDAEAIKASVSGMSLDDLKGQFENLSDGGEGLRGTLAAIAHKEKFKYSRPFGVGLYTLVETAASEDALKDKETVEALFKDLASKLNISPDKLQKDVELYRSNLEKFAQAQEVMKDMLAADRKKREERQKAAEAAAEAINESVATAPKAAESGEAAE
ncbi:photosystem II biogenesis protein Psp29 [Nodosilinea sp. LEGE 07298]|uniref:photosystem II biogenesis protein Psp29 n=1 Tax=Nodosilinea sp. LEGE 07298 TaxID=2777970 RepID=UPI00187F2067|nr:photosystem II biogenesis protein Psp29 [Nodosilinea sp. LEGE 07298]MBE9111490.1 photosystem II biogenesis protein Psp29 [Nodosilinea sp. LEGE 07298]